MRQIKFRAWHLVNKVMHENKSLSVLAKNIKDDSVWRYMQFTGLTDKNGVDVYEGDIINDHIGVGVVEYKEDKCAYRVNYCRGNYAKWFVDYILSGEIDSVQVIGNIYEHPNLLEK